MTITERIDALPEPKRSELLSCLEVFRPTYVCGSCGKEKREAEMDGPETCAECVEESQRPHVEAWRAYA